MNESKNLFTLGLGLGFFALIVCLLARLAQL